jgi:hypothetical protein
LYLLTEFSFLALSQTLHLLTKLSFLALSQTLHLLTKLSFLALSQTLHLLTKLSFLALSQTLHLLTKLSFLAHSQTLHLLTKLSFLALSQTLHLLTKLSFLALSQTLHLLTKLSFLALSQTLHLLTKLSFLALSQTLHLLTKLRKLHKIQSAKYCLTITICYFFFLGGGWLWAVMRCLSVFPGKVRIYRSGRRTLRKSEMSIHVVTYICIYKGVQLKTPDTLGTDRSQYDDPSPVLSPSNILPPLSSPCTFISARKYSLRVMEMLLFKCLFFIFKIL